MNIKRIITGILCGSLIFMFAACGENSPESQMQPSEKVTSKAISEECFEWNEEDHIWDISDEIKQEKEIIIPARCKGLGKGLFSECECETISFESDDDIFLDSFAFSAIPNLKSLDLPTNLSIISDWAISSDDNLGSITIPAHVKTIAGYAFSYDESLKEVSFAGTELEAIGDYAFQHCKSLEKIKLPEGLESLGVDVFRGCDNLTEIYLPESLTFIDGDLLGMKTEGLTVYVKKDSWADQNRAKWDPTGFSTVVTE